MLPEWIDKIKLGFSFSTLVQQIQEAHSQQQKFIMDHYVVNGKVTADNAKEYLGKASTFS